MYIYVGVDPGRKFIYTLQSTHIEQRVDTRWKVVVNTVLYTCISIYIIHVQCTYSI